LAMAEQVIEGELDEMESHWRVMQGKARRLHGQLERELSDLTAQRLHLDHEKKVMGERFRISESIVELNVGGKHFTTFLSSLCKYEGSMLEAMFSGRHPLSKDAKGRYFIDRPAEPFAVILEWLQTGQFIWPHGDSRRKRLKLELEYFGLNDFLYSLARFDSVILSQDDMSRLHEWLSEETKWELCYRGSRDGFRAFNFHQKVDNVASPSLVVIKTTSGHVFGGYTSVGWSSRAGFHKDKTSFLFTLHNPLNRPQRVDCVPSTNAVYHNPNYGPIFGGKCDPNYVSIYGGIGPDLCVVDNCNQGNHSYINVHTSFVTSGYIPFTDQQFFTVLEMEVFRQDVSAN